jgi:hypothetical protein
LPAGTFPMLAKYAPYTESHSHAIPLGEVWLHRGGAFEEIRGIRRSEFRVRSDTIQ